MDNPGFLSPSSILTSSSLRMIAPHETLESIFLSNQPLQTPIRNDVFNRLFLDSNIRRKNREIGINSMQKTPSKTTSKQFIQGNRIEDILIRKGKELNLKKQRLIDRIEEERNQHLRHVPEINAVSKMLANTDYVNRYYSGGTSCSHSSYGGSTLRSSSRPSNNGAERKTRPLSAAKPAKYQKNQFNSPKHVQLELDFEDEDLTGNTVRISEAEKLYNEALNEVERLDNLAFKEKEVIKPAGRYPAKRKDLEFNLALNAETIKPAIRTPAQKDLDFTKKVETQKKILEKLQSAVPYSFGNTLLEPEYKEAYLQPSEFQDPVSEEARYTPFIKPSVYPGEGLYPERTPIVNLASPSANTASHQNLSSYNSLRSMQTIEIPESMTDRVLLQSPPTSPQPNTSNRQNFTSINSLRSMPTIEIPESMTDRVLLQSPISTQANTSNRQNLTSLNSLRSLPTIEIPESMTDRVLLQSPLNPPHYRSSSGAVSSGEVTNRASAMRPYLLNLKSSSNISIERSAVLKQIIIDRKKQQNHRKPRK